NKSKYLKIIVISIYILFLVATTVKPIEAQTNERELFLVAQKAFEDGFYDVAIRYIDQLLTNHPKTEKETQAQLLLGQCYFFQAKYLKAYEVFQKLLGLSELQDATLFWLGETYLKGSDFNQAEKHYLQIIKIYPESIYTPQAYYSLGWVYFEQNKYEDAKKAFIDLLEIFPNHQLSEDANYKLGEIEYNLSNYESSIDYFTYFLEIYPKSTKLAESYFYIAESYYYLENNLSSIAYYAKSEENSYDSKLVLMSKVSMGWCYLKLNKLKLAEQKFDDALAYSKEKGILSDDVLLGQASLYSETKEYDKALEAYSNLVDQFPNSKKFAESYLGKASSYYLLGDFKQAISTYRSFIKDFENSDQKEMIEKASFGLAWSYLKDGNIDESIKIFEAVKAKTKNNIVRISALSQIGDAYQDSDQLDKAVEIYDKILKEYTDSPYTDYVQYRQGIALLKMNKVDAASLSFQSLKANFPKSNYLKDINYYLAVANFKKEDWDTAIEYISEFMKDLPETNTFLAESYYILALSEFNLRQYSKALKSFQNIIRIYPSQTAMKRDSEINIAKCYYELKDIKEAIKRFNLLVNNYPQSETAQEALLWLGDYYLEASEYDKAIAHYLEFINRFPGSEKLPVVHYELGQAHQAKGEYDLALNAFKKIDDSKYNEVYAKAKLAIAVIFEQELNPESAIQTYQSIIDSSPEFKKDAYVKIAEIHKTEHNYSGALEAYINAVNSKPGLSKIKNAKLQFYIGDTCELLNKSEQAIEEYLKIPYIYPSDISWVTRAYLRIARIFEDSDNWDGAVLTYKKIIELKTDEAKFAKERLDWIKVNIK
ncbi:MAG: tetratricopeptide repeat protein, partial [Candidatus Omnitrophica bacterium]|nr:tetratricopeptide repeat protein [Candidatus Omnitrophota bacterium]